MATMVAMLGLEIDNEGSVYMLESGGIWEDLERHCEWPHRQDIQISALLAIRLESQCTYWSRCCATRKVEHKRILASPHRTQCIRRADVITKRGRSENGNALSEQRARKARSHVLCLQS